jgi:hypothetical protein
VSSFKSSWLVAAMLGLAALTPATTAFAQVPGALGQPLPAPDLPAGTVSVKVIAGKVSEPVTGVDVTLIVNGTPREARTDSAGRAMFPNLPAGAKIQAKVQDEEKKDVVSDEFPLSDAGGQRLLLSTRPFVPMGGTGGAPFAGGAAGGGGMPEPRQLSGEPRPEATDQPGTYTVRLTYDDLQDKTPPVGVSVFLVGYNADDSIKTFEAKTDANGRATFGDLDRTGATSYFAMAQLVRGEGADQKVDRLVSTPAVLDTRSGVRLILSSAKRDSTDPAIDDLVKIDKQDGAPAEPGKLHVVMVGVPEEGGTIELLAFKPGGGKRTIAKTLASRSAPNPQDIQGRRTRYAYRSTAADSTRTTRSAASRCGSCRPRQRRRAICRASAASRRRRIPAFTTSPIRRRARSSPRSRSTARTCRPSRSISRRAAACSISRSTGTPRASSAPTSTSAA